MNFFKFFFFIFATVNLSLAGLQNTHSAWVVPGAVPSTFSGKVFDTENPHDLLALFRSNTEARSEIQYSKSEYANPTGELLLSEESWTSAGKLLKLKILQNQLQEEGSIEVLGEKAYFHWAKVGAKQKAAEATEVFDERFVVPPTLVDFIKKNWTPLMLGQKVSMRFAVIERLTTYGFQLQKIREETRKETREENHLVVIEMKPSSFFIARLVDPLLFKIEKETLLLHSFEGRSPFKKKNGSTLKDFNAFIAYDYTHFKNQ